MHRYVRGGWAEKYQSSLRENLEAPMTKAAAKVNVCHPEEKDFSVDVAGWGVGAIDLCTDVVVRGEGVDGVGERRGGVPLRLLTQTLNYMLVHEHMGWKCVHKHDGKHNAGFGLDTRGS